MKKIWIWICVLTLAGAALGWGAVWAFNAKSDRVAVGEFEAGEIRALQERIDEATRLRNYLIGLEARKAGIDLNAYNYSVSEGAFIRLEVKDESN